MYLPPMNVRKLLILKLSDTFLARSGGRPTKMGRVTSITSNIISKWMVWY